MHHPSFIQRLWLLLRLAVQMYRANRQNGAYHRSVLKKAGRVVSEAELLDDGSLPPLLFKKMQWYMVNLAVTGRLLTMLRGKPLSGTEEKSFIYLGAIMALFDSLVDEQPDPEIPARLLEQFTKQTGPDIKNSPSAIEKIFALYSSEFYRSTDEFQWERLSVHFRQIGYQLRSGIQKQTSLTEEEMLKLTLGKGGVSMLLCQALLFERNTKTEKAFYDLGGLIQLLNDAQDVHKDALKGIRTFMNYTQNWTEAAGIPEAQKEQTFTSFHACNFSESRLYPFLFNIAAMVTVIQYKLTRYAEHTNKQLIINEIAGMERKDFLVNPFSLRSLLYCVPRILVFRTSPENL